jgi:Tfp pilus assembly protein PilF
MARGEWAEADTALSTALEDHRRIGSVTREAQTLTFLGRCAIGLGDGELARERLTQARELWESMGADTRMAEVDDILGAA